MDPSSMTRPRPSSSAQQHSSSSSRSRRRPQHYEASSTSASIFNEDDQIDYLTAMQDRENRLPYSMRYRCRPRPDPQQQEGSSHDPSTMSPQTQLQECYDVDGLYRGRYEMSSFLFERSCVDFNLDLEVAEVAIDLLDRYLLAASRRRGNVAPTPSSTLYDVTKSALACLNLAVKLYSPCAGCPYKGWFVQRYGLGPASSNSNAYATKTETDAHTPSYQEFTDKHFKTHRQTPPDNLFNRYAFDTALRLSEEKCSAQDLDEAEWDVAKTLKYALHPPTVTGQLRLLFQHAAKTVAVDDENSTDNNKDTALARNPPFWLQELERTAMTMVRPSNITCNQGCHRPSVVALACLGAAVEITLLVKGGESLKQQLLEPLPWNDKNDETETDLAQELPKLGDNFNAVLNLAEQSSGLSRTDEDVLDVWSKLYDHSIGQLEEKGCRLVGGVILPASCAAAMPPSSCHSPPLSPSSSSDVVVGTPPIKLHPKEGKIALDAGIEKQDEMPSSSKTSNNHAVRCSSVPDMLTYASKTPVAVSPDETAREKEDSQQAAAKILSGIRRRGLDSIPELREDLLDDEGPPRKKTRTLPPRRYRDVDGSFVLRRHLRSRIAVE